MKLLVALVTLVGLGSVAATIWIGARVKEPTVVADPYEEGLRYDERRRERAQASGAAPSSAGRDAAVSFEIAPSPPRAMADLEFTVRAPSVPADAQATLALAMPGMYMGEHRVALARAADGAWRGKGVVVRCASGGRRWEAKVELRPRGGAPVVRTFPFEVAE
jgi:hypothetical protein